MAGPDTGTYSVDELSNSELEKLASRLDPPRKSANFMAPVDDVSPL